MKTTALFLALVVTASCVAQTSKVQADAQRAAKAAASLRVIAIEDMDTNVPAAAQSLIPELRDAMRSLSSDVIAGHDAKVQPLKLTQEIQKALHAANLDPIDPAEHPPEKTADQKEKNVYGNITTAAFDDVPGHPDLIVFRTNQIIACGSDAAIYVFQWKDGKWTEVVAHGADRYKEISGAFEGLDYSISPSAPDGSWFVLVAHWNPWCSSNWQGLTYAVLRPSAPAQIWKRGIYLGNDVRAKLATDPNGFTVEYEGRFGDPSILIRPHIERYRYTQQKFKRVSPIAADALDFVDEWISLPSQDAQTWTAPPSADAAKWHKLLNVEENANPPQWNVNFFQACPGGKTWQVALDLDGDKSTPKQLYFVVDKNPDFHLTAVSPARPTGCPGETPVPQRSTKLP